MTAPTPEPEPAPPTKRSDRVQPPDWVFQPHLRRGAAIDMTRCRAMVYHGFHGFGQCPRKNRLEPWTDPATGETYLCCIGTTGHHPGERQKRADARAERTRAKAEVAVQVRIRQGLREAPLDALIAELERRGLSPMPLAPEPAPVPVPVPPPKLSPEARGVIEGLLSVVEQGVCRHDNRYRGGAIWTICRDCGQQWADDRGGYRPYVDPPEVLAAEAFLAREVGP